MFRVGAPAGIAREFKELQVVMPTVDEDYAKIHCDDLVTDYGHSRTMATLRMTTRQLKPSCDTWKPDTCTVQTQRKSVLISWADTSLSSIS